MSFSPSDLPDLAKQLINQCQRNFPLTSRPFLALSEEFDCSEDEIIECMEMLDQHQILSRIGPVFDHKQAGASTLAALAVPEKDLDLVAAQVNAFEEVNHNYAREHDYNLWFVATAKDNESLSKVLADIASITGHEPLVLPMEAAYHIDLSFEVCFNHQHQQKVVIS